MINTTRKDLLKQGFDVTRLPLLMENREDKSVVLITGVDHPNVNKGTGFVVERGNTTYSLGQYHKDWQLVNFVEYHGSITLENNKA